MSSTDKTFLLQLNQWDSSDIPKREDFNADNQIIDEFFMNHLEDSISHIMPSERTKWNTPYYTESYFGDGQQTRTIDTDCPFKPSFGIIFAVGAPAISTRFDSKLSQHNFAFITQRGSTLGASLSDKKITVKNKSTPEIDSEYVSLNSVGYTYLYILFR